MRVEKIFSLSTVFAWIAAIAMLGVATIPAKASIVTDYSDTMSSQTAGAFSNHDFSFVTRTGASEGSTITVSFASSFNISAINVGDVDVTDDGVDLTLAANCGGTEKASVSFSGNVVTITICPGDSGTISAGSVVNIEIGTNATAQVSGTQQIRNSVTVGSYTIVVGGSFGDRGTLAIVTSSSGSVAVGGTVSGGGGGGGYNSGDTNSPIISNIQIVNITETSATVIWETNELADSVVDFGKTAGHELGSVSNGSLVVSHSIDLPGLIPGTTYHFLVRSHDGTGNEGSSSDLTFTTLSPVDTLAPIIVDVQAINITGSSARIVWVTNELANSKVEYGLTVAYGLGSVSDVALVVDHGIDLIGLTSQTTYYYRVRSTDASGNEAISGDFTFTTTDITPPVISNVQVVDITQTSARVIWTTNEPATSVVSYGKTNIHEIGTVSDGTLLVSHSIVLSGFSKNTVYHYIVRSVDASNNASQSNNATFTTRPDITAPANVTDFTAVQTGPSTAHLTWQNPPDIDLAGIVIVRRSDRFPTGPNNGTVIFNGLANSTNDTGLVAGVTYRYGAYAYDQTGNFASGALAQLTITATCGDRLCTTGETPQSCLVDCEVPIRPACGNNICEAGETKINCPVDCGVPQVVCGNDKCEISETPQNCPVDCPVIPQTRCGDGSCEEGENTASCPIDCGTIPTLVVCGNLVCEEGEIIDSCPVDCPIIVIPPITVETGSELTLTDLNLYVGNGQIELIPKINTYEVLINSVLLVRVDFTSFKQLPTEVHYILGSSAYSLVPGQSSFTTTIITPQTTGTFPATLSVFYSNGTNDRLDSNVKVLPRGRVITETSNILPNTTTTLLDSTGTEFGTGYLSELNPMFTGSDGSFAWYVPNGNYRLRVSKDGYQDQELAIPVINNIINPEVLLRIPPLTLAEIFSSDLSVTKKITDLAKTALKDISKVVSNPQVKEVAGNIVAPIVAAVAVVVSTSAATVVGLGNILRFLFTQPLLFFARRKRKAWGIVYNAVTKVPIDLVTVRLRDAQTNRLIQTRVTDRGGRYFFIAQPGNYKLEVQKHGFIFPTQYLARATQDEFFLDLYHSEPIVVNEKDATIAANIPLDPEVREATPVQVLRKLFLRRLETVISLVSLIIAAGVVIINPTSLTIGLFVIQVIFYTILVVFIQPRKPKGWGIVYDSKTKKPLKRAIVRIFEPTYGKLLEMQVTDTKGRYSFLAGPSKYHVAAEKEGYQTQTIDVNFQGHKEPEVVRESVLLDPHNAVPQTPTTTQSNKPTI